MKAWTEMDAAERAAAAAKGDAVPLLAPCPAAPPSVLDRGHQLGQQLEAVETAVRALVGDLSVPEPWPGRDAEAHRAAGEAISHIRQARSSIGVLAGVLAQDRAP